MNKKIHVSPKIEENKKKKKKMVKVKKNNWEGRLI